jgi:hypothetical protein
MNALSTFGKNQYRRLPRKAQVAVQGYRLASALSSHALLAASTYS